MKKHITERHLAEYAGYLAREEKSAATIEKYLRDVRAFAAYAGRGEICKKTVIAYKEHLQESYKAASINSMLAALNSFFAFADLSELKVKSLKMQRRAYCSADKELSKAEYNRLIEAAEHEGNRRIAAIVQTICATGIRVSELRFITVEAVRRGEAVICLKGKTRTAFIPKKLKRLLERYIAQNEIASGPVFVTRSGKPMNRSNIWREMKALCESAGVDAKKVFPHNLRHLFARTFYALDKDIAKLADILGHSSITTTRIYLMEAGAEHARRIDKLGLVA